MSGCGEVETKCENGARLSKRVAHCRAEGGATLMHDHVSQLFAGKLSYQADSSLPNLQLASEERKV